VKKGKQTERNKERRDENERNTVKDEEIKKNRKLTIFYISVTVHCVM
jgi:hypothetical protein